MAGREDGKRLVLDSALLASSAAAHQHGEQERMLDSALLPFSAASRKRGKQQRFQGTPFTFALGGLGTLGLCGGGHGMSFQVPG